MEGLRVVVAVACLSMVAGCASPSDVTILEAAGPVAGQKVIVDYSPTVSDVGALLYLLARPDVDVVAITLPTTGEAGCDLGHRVTLGLLALMDRADIPVACGTGPDQAETWPAEFLADQVGLLTGLPEPGGEPSDAEAVDLMERVLAQSDDPITILAVAPLTNVAQLLEQRPDAVDGVGRIVIMGGAVDVDGNVPSGDAEWNLFIDAEATARVLGSGAPVTLVPLDATNDVPVPSDYPDMLDRAGRSAALDYLTVLTGIFPYTTEGGFYFWDELAALVAVDAVAVEAADTGVAVGNEGQTVRDEDGTMVQVIVGVPEPEAMYEEFLGRLAAATP